MISNSRQHGRTRLVDLASSAQKGFRGSLAHHAARPLEKALALDLLNDLYSLLEGQPTPQEFIARCLEHLQISFTVPQKHLDLIPATGPLIVVANHPFGAIEGIVLASMLLQRRPDAKILANHLLGRIPELRDLFFLVNVLQTDAARENLRSMRQVLSHIRHGGVLGMFPAGEVAHLSWTGQINEGPWTPHLARIIRAGKCPVLPVHFAGNNSLMFHIAGLCHPRLRTALLARELFKLRNTRIDIRVGTPIPAQCLSRISDDAQLIQYARTRTMALAGRSSEAPKARPMPRYLAPIVPPVRQILLEAEVNSLDEHQRLVDSGDMVTCLASAHQIPHTLREIGRLREVTFRQTGEGTGRESDIDRYDEFYQHLFVWHRPTSQIVGGYRIGFSEQLLRHDGVRGFYTHSLFRFRPQLLEQTGPVIELGRSFVRQEFQKSYAPLLMLWKGIGQVAARNPRYCHLLGPVSISAQYQSVSREMMVDFLNCHFTDPQLNGCVKPRRAFRTGFHRPFSKRAGGNLPPDPEHLSELVSDLEEDGKGIPILLRQYLRLGARVLSFNIDPDFADVLDVLILVDMRRAERKLLDRYMGNECATAFLAHHGQQAPADQTA